MENKSNIFEALKTANVVGGVGTSMQDPDIDTDALERAIAGTADDAEVVLWARALTRQPCTR